MYMYCLIILVVCKTGQFSCGNNKCIADNLRCNKKDDCGDSSDERACYDGRLLQYNIRQHKTSVLCSVINSIYVYIYYSQCIRL